MATKAELEAELAALRKQLGERAEPTTVSEPEAESAEANEDDTENSNWEQDIAELVAEFEDFPHKQTILLALGVFALGYLIGRTR